MTDYEQVSGQDNSFRVILPIPVLYVACCGGMYHDTRMTEVLKYLHIECMLL